MVWDTVIASTFCANIAFGLFAYKDTSAPPTEMGRFVRKPDPICLSLSFRLAARAVSYSFGNFNHEKVFSNLGNLHW